VYSDLFIPYTDVVTNHGDAGESSTAVQLHFSCFAGTIDLDLFSGSSILQELISAHWEVNKSAADVLRHVPHEKKYRKQKPLHLNTDTRRQMRNMTSMRRREIRSASKEHGMDIETEEDDPRGWPQAKDMLCEVGWHSLAAQAVQSLRSDAAKEAAGGVDAFSLREFEIIDVLLAAPNPAATLGCSNTFISPTLLIQLVVAGLRDVIWIHVAVIARAFTRFADEEEHLMYRWGILSCSFGFLI
jgi:hypothetical protein